MTERTESPHPDYKGIWEVRRPFLRKVRPLIGLMDHYFRYEVRDIERIPKNGPSLVVMNHGVLPFHGFLLVKRIFERLHRYPRELGASFLFEIPVVRDFFARAGAVNADPHNAEALLKRGEIVLVSPGGIYEALLCEPGMQEIPWGRRKGFVRVAARLGVPIVPTFCQGIAEAYVTSRLFLKARIKILEKTRFSLPFFFGIGLLPFPVKLTHWIGKPVSTKPRRGESFAKRVERIHAEVVAAEASLAQGRH